VHSGFGKPPAESAKLVRRTSHLKSEIWNLKLESET
jgi:hypothetical protein